MKGTKMRRKNITLTVVLAVLQLCSGQGAQPGEQDTEKPVFVDLNAIGFNGGAGEPNDPFQIATAQQLVSIGDDPNLLDKHFVLIYDIDLDPNGPDGYIFDRAVIASDLDEFFFDFQGTAFTGRLDGQNRL